MLSPYSEEIEREVSTTMNAFKAHVDSGLSPYIWWPRYGQCCYFWTNWWYYYWQYLSREDQIYLTSLEMRAPQEGEVEANAKETIGVYLEQQKEPAMQDEPPKAVITWWWWYWPYLPAENKRTL